MYQVNLVFQCIYGCNDDGGEDGDGKEGCVLDESSKDGAQRSRKVASGGRVAGAIRSLVNARDFVAGVC